jgi:hypothetical protein
MAYNYRYSNSPNNKHHLNSTHRQLADIGRYTSKPHSSYIRICRNSNCLRWDRKHNQFLYNIFVYSIFLGHICQHSRTCHLHYNHPSLPNMESTLPGYMCPYSRKSHLHYNHPSHTHNLEDAKGNFPIRHIRLYIHTCHLHYNQTTQMHIHNYSYLDNIQLSYQDR